MSILAIQSHVAYGHVGNAAGVFILRRLGFEVWPVHTVLYSNHPGYGDFRGQIMSADHITDIIAGIEARDGFPDCEAVLCGYLGTAENGRVALEAVTRVKTVRPDVRFMLDPVMGDRDGGVYVSDEVVAFYREEALAHADVLKPNAFELQTLSNMPVDDISSALNAARTLMARWDIGTIVVSSVPADEADALACIALNAGQAWVVCTPNLPVEQKGAGDAFMALFVGRYLSNPDRIDMALSAAVSSIWGITEVTHQSGHDELRLVAAQDLIVDPARVFSVHAI